MYVYKLGTKKKYLYDSDLASLRVKEKQINKDKDDGIRTQEAMKLTLNDMFKVYMNNNIKLKPSTRANYLYLWDFYVKEEPFANMPLPQIHRSDILAFYTKLLKHGFAINSLESIGKVCCRQIAHGDLRTFSLQLSLEGLRCICGISIDGCVSDQDALRFFRFPL